jgi:ABC-type lipoprotein release transport system permease subunit
MLMLKLAFRNLVGAGLRTWLNAFVLSFSFVVIIWHKGFLDGWDRQARRDTIGWEIGGGQYWHDSYDPYDPLTLDDSHGPVPDSLARETAAVLIAQATIYPEGRMQNVLLKGIDPLQRILRIPSSTLAGESYEVPALIGTRAAGSYGLKKGDVIAVRWRDANGTFDAADARIVGLFKTTVPTVDGGQLWVPLDRLRSMLGVEAEATILVTGTGSEPRAVSGWDFKNHGELLAEIDQIIKQKAVGGAVMYAILLLLAMLALFDTQVLSIFRRQKEIGTHIALGMTRGQVVAMFTVEGGVIAMFAVAIAAIYGIPFLAFQAATGIPMPAGSDDYGFAIAERVFPAYSLGLVAATTLTVFVTATIVSFIPASKIARMRPTDAIRGKIQ